MSKTNPHIPGQEAHTPAPPRFQIASRLGAFRDTATILDPFGTGAVFTIHRNGSKAHKAWFREQQDHDPMTLAVVESGLMQQSGTVLTKEEEEIVQTERQGKDPNALLPIVDRLTFTLAEQDIRREAMRRLFDSGRITPSEWVSRGENDLLKEALFALKGWDHMPSDEEGVMVPYSEEAARALLENDTPLEGAGIDDLILSVDAWSLEIEQEGETVPTEVTDAVPVIGGTGTWKWKTRIMIPGLTLGRAYQLLILNRSRDISLFRDRVLGEAAKNSEPSSDSINSSGDGKSSEAAPVA